MDPFFKDDPGWYVGHRKSPLQWGPVGGVQVAVSGREQGPPTCFSPSLWSLCSRGLISSPAAGCWSPAWLRPHPSLTPDSVCLGKLVHPQPSEPVHLRLQIYCPAQIPSLGFHSLTRLVCNISSWVS